MSVILGAGTLTATATDRSNATDKELFLQIKPERVDEKHGILKFHIKSPVFGKFFSSICPDKDQLTTAKRLGDVCHLYGKAKKPDGSSIYLKRINQAITGMSGKPVDGLILSDFQTPNMVLLTAVGIEDGIDFMFTDMYTDEAIENAVSNMYKKAKQIFRSYIKQVSVEFEVYMKEIN